ncbi:O-antigen polymerase [Hyella patelloides LEGE 07179]|uniref:O-antigen polymerase n=1 Tax=Hyella patelloides LEGE 07179 TaxID=945734 RepID=A0A563VSM5_9CYAN|nr:O-antigen ligase family protein [Hyella patelloides]VEP14289.1 O-antigen polymerase [Hyella patelloides LEGE 07179]
MMRSDQQSPNHWVEKLEVAITIFWLLYFMGVSLPDPFPKNINALSYPIIAILFALHWKRLSWVATRDIPLLLLVGTVVASAFWSTNMRSTLEASRGFVRMFLFGAYLTTCYSLKTQMKILTWVFGIAGILSTAVVLLIPSYGISSVHIGAWEGIFAHKGMLGDVMSIGAILFLLNALQEKTPNWIAWGGFGLAATINILTDSASSLLSFLILLSLIPLYNLLPQPYKLKAIIFSLGLIGIGVMVVFIVGNIDTILAEVLQQSTDGRISIWTLMIDKVSEERPLLGYGFNAFWSSDAGAFVGRYAWEESVVATEFNSHSSYMELYVSLGYLGVVVYAISFITVFFRTVILLLATRKIQFLWFIQFLVFAHVAAISNVGKIASGASSYWVIYVSICLATAVEYRKIRYGQVSSINTHRLQKYQ